MFLAAEQESPEVRYKGQLQASSPFSAGFFSVVFFEDQAFGEKCLLALGACSGNAEHGLHRH